MITAIDSNILFDILVSDNEFAAQSEEAIESAMTVGSIVISEPVFAELAARFPSQASLEEFLAKSRVRLEPSNRRSLFVAGSAWAQYARSRPPGFMCSDCGTLQQVGCVACKQALGSRQHVLSDFLIGAHAHVQADRLLTRDRGYFRTYFPDLQLN